MMMTNAEFITKLNERGRHFEATEKTVNGIVHEGAMEKPQNDRRIAPVIYTSYFIERVEKGESLDTVTEEFIQFYDSNIPNTEPESLDEWTRKEYVLEHVVPVVRSQDKEMSGMDVIETLEELGLNLYAKVDIPELKGTYGVKEEMLKAIGISKEELLEAMKRNVERELVHLPMKEMMIAVNPEMADILNEMPSEGLENPDLVVVTNKEKFNGAGIIAYPDLIGRLGKKHNLGDKFIIIPSSIHELLLWEWDESISEKAIGGMIQEVNSNEVSPEEILSDSPFIYENGEIRKA